jgi:predicted PurR-regulated permease PerM
LTAFNRDGDNDPDEVIEVDIKEERSFTHRLWLTVGVVTAVFITLFLLWYAIKIILAIFGGILFGVLLNGISSWLSAHTSLSRKISLAITLGLLLILIVGGGWLLIPNITDQVAQLGEQLRAAIGQLQVQLAESEFGQSILDQITNFQATNNPPVIFSRASDIFSSTLNAIAYAAIILFVGIYLAYEPHTYVEGLLKLAPIPRRSRYHEALDETAHSLRWWLVGQFASMLVIGTLTVIGLMIIGVPLAFVLGLLAGLLAFIPIFGPILALSAPMLIAFTDDPQKGLYVMLLYAAIQIVETYILTPLIQKRVTSLPPVLLISSQVLLNFFAGLLGVMMAAPLAVTGMVLVKMLYVEDVLGDHDVEYVDGQN